MLPRSAIDMDTGLLARSTSGLLFVIPWEGYWLVGDTDTEWNAEPGRVLASRADVAILLERLNSQLRAPVPTDQVLGVFAGLRPLVAAAPERSTVELSREHTIATPMPGLSVISGGQYTTYRVMAAHLVDTVVADLAPSDVPRSVTDTTPLIGADGYSSLWRQRRRLPDEHGLPLAAPERLLRRYGSCVEDLLEMLAQRPGLARVVAGSDGVLAVEVVYAYTHEGARHLEDVLDRRTRIAIQSPDRGEATMEDVLALMRATLGWSSDMVHQERVQYRRLLAEERRGLTADHGAGPGAAA